MIIIIKQYTDILYFVYSRMFTKQIKTKKIFLPNLKLLFLNDYLDQLLNLRVTIIWKLLFFGMDKTNLQQ